MIDIQWGDFAFRVEGTAAALLVAIPLMLVMQLPQFQRMVHAIVRRTRSHRLVSSIAYRVRQSERQR